MKDIAEKKNEDLENIRKKIDELVGFAWERGYKCGQADRQEPVEAEHEICVGDVVTSNSSRSEEIILGITTGVDGKPWASMYSQDYAVPQMMPISSLKYTGKHIDITNIFDQLFNHIKGDKKNDRS